MAPFTNDDTNRLDWTLLQNGAVTLYWRMELLERDTAWLAEHGYVVHTIDCSYLPRFNEQMSKALRFKENFGYELWSDNLSALNDAFRQVEFPGVGGAAMRMLAFDQLHRLDRRFAHGVLDIIESNSRDHLLMGNRLLALVQSSDPRIIIDPIGARSAEWNRQEWLNASRGL